jgi:hypothetical protein
MNRPTLRIAFSDFHRGFNPKDNRIWKVLAVRYSLELVDFGNKPNFLVYSDFGIKHWAFDGLKIYITGENMVPDFKECDLAFTPFEISNEPRAIRLPYYAQILTEPERLIRSNNYTAAHLKNQSKFCAFVVSNPKSPERNKFFKELNRRLPVDSGGRHFNNLGKVVSDKISFIKNYRFTIAFENTSSPGYTTEKLIEPLLAGSIPIYWGNPEVSRDFNPGCMINVNEFPDFTAAINYILLLENNLETREKILTTPVFKDNCLPECLSDDYIVKPIENLLQHGKVGQRHYRKRRLREHVYTSWLKQTQVSIICRAESLLWRWGLKF